MPLEIGTTFTVKGAFLASRPEVRPLLQCNSFLISLIYTTTESAASCRKKKSPVCPTRVRVCSRVPGDDARSWGTLIGLFSNAVPLPIQRNAAHAVARRGPVAASGAIPVLDST